MQFDKATFHQFREDVKQALKSVCDKYDVDIETGNITYSNSTFSMKLEAKERMDPTARFMDDYRNSWLFAYPINAGMLNQKFRGQDGKVYKLVGVKRAAKRTSKALVVEGDNGQQYVCTPEFLGITQPSDGNKLGNRI